MNIHTVRRIIRDLKSEIAQKTNDHLAQFGIEINLIVTKHVVDRLFDRSMRVDVDIEKIRGMLEELMDFHLGKLLHKAFFSEDPGLIIYKTYRNNLQDCLALALEVTATDNGKFQVIVRTFMPAAGLTYVKQRDNILLAPKRKVRLVSNLQKMLYSDNCPEALKILR